MRSSTFLKRKVGGQSLKKRHTPTNEECITGADIGDRVFGVLQWSQQHNSSAKTKCVFLWKKQPTIWNEAGSHNRRTNANVCLDKPRSNVRSNNSITVLVWLLSNMFETTVFRISWPNRSETRLAGKKYKNSWIVHFWNDLESCPSWPFFCLAVDGLAFELDYWLRICEDCDLCFVAIVLLFYNYCVAIPLWEIRACPIEKQWEWRKGNSRLFIYV